MEFSQLNKIHCKFPSSLCFSTMHFSGKNNNVFTVSGAVHFGLRVSFLSYQFIKITSSSKIQTNFIFRVVVSKPQGVKSLKQEQKTMALCIGTFCGWKHRRYCEQRIQITCSFFYQFNFSILVLEVCFRSTPFT